ncbi:hypothetical protein [Neisseria gonorrhoeae]|nr:hypothetical protein [Neisseria gonorrhoeae]
MFGAMALAAEAHTPWILTEIDNSNLTGVSMFDVKTRVKIMA